MGLHEDTDEKGRLEYFAIGAAIVAWLLHIVMFCTAQNSSARASVAAALLVRAISFGFGSLTRFSAYFWERFQQYRPLALLSALGAACSLVIYLQQSAISITYLVPIATCVVFTDFMLNCVLLYGSLLEESQGQQGRRSSYFALLRPKPQSDMEAQEERAPTVVLKGQHHRKDFSPFDDDDSVLWGQYWWIQLFVQAIAFVAILLVDVPTAHSQLPRLCFCAVLYISKIQTLRSSSGCGYF